MEHNMKSEPRLLYIMEKLAKGECSNSHLAHDIFGEDNDKNRTNVRNSIKALKAHFGERLVETRKGYHKLIDIPKVLRTIDKNTSNDMMGVFEFIALFESDKLEMFESDEPSLVRKIKKETRVLYHLFDFPFETIDNHDTYRQIKKSIKMRRYLSIAYEKNKLLTYNNIKPIRIVYAYNNWYLAALLTENVDTYDFTFFRINHIKHIKMEAKSFHDDMQIQKHLENMQSLFQRYGMPSYTVTLNIAKEIAVYFKQKAYLKSQKIIDEKSDGTLLVSYEITNDMEIMPIIQKWLPHIKIVEPRELQDTVSKLFKDYIA